MDKLNRDLLLQKNQLELMSQKLKNQDEILNKKN